MPMKILLRGDAKDGHEIHVSDGLTWIAFPDIRTPTSWRVMYEPTGETIGGLPVWQGRAESWPADPAMPERKR